MLHRAGLGPTWLRWLIRAAVTAVALLVAALTKWPRTLAQFVDDVHAGQITYFVESGRMRSHDRNGGEIADWVQQHYRPVKVGGATVYRLG